MTELSEEEKKAIELIKEFLKYGYSLLDLKYDNNRARTNHRIENAFNTVLNLIQKQDTEINKLNNVIDRIKNYAYQEVAHITEDIKDYIDDDKEGNKNIIGEFKETREQWKDIMRIIEGKADTDLYVNWKEWGEYE